MSKARIERYIPDAMELVQRELLPKYKGGIPSAFYGYISSFGASIIQSGLKPTLALFENEKAQTQTDRAEVPKLILKLIDQKGKGSEQSLLAYLLDQKDEKQTEEVIKDIAVALKLAMRTFPKKGDEDE